MLLKIFILAFLSGFLEELAAEIQRQVDDLDVDEDLGSLSASQRSRWKNASL